MLDIYTVTAPTQEQYDEAQTHSRKLWQDYIHVEQAGGDVFDAHERGEATLEDLGAARQATHLASIAYTMAHKEELAMWRALKSGEVETVDLAAGNTTYGCYSETLHAGGNTTYWETLHYNSSTLSRGLHHNGTTGAWTLTAIVRAPGRPTERDTFDISAAEAEAEVRLYRTMYRIDVPATVTN